MPENEELAKLLADTPKTEDPELLKLALLLANKVMDNQNLKFDGEGHLLTRDVNF
jgi:hypothetical protein